ncbi:UNVERIFIED_CONTAM: hypothetical protein FKN15_071968 [Acipenser sinensis]
MTETQEATRKQRESNQQWRQERGFPTQQLEFPVSGLQRLLQKGVWPAPKQESSVPELQLPAAAQEPPVAESEPPTCAGTRVVRAGARSARVATGRGAEVPSSTTVPTSTPAKQPGADAYSLLPHALTPCQNVWTSLCST